MTAPMMMKIHRATPASFKLIDLANAGVAIRVTKPTVNPVIHDLFPFNMPHSPFLFDFNLNECISYAKEKNITNLS
jgi:hypothetical protein